MEAFYHEKGEVLVERRRKPFSGVPRARYDAAPETGGNAYDQSLLLHCGVWEKLAARTCFFQASGYKHWLEHCPCEQCELRRIDVNSKPQMPQKAVTACDEQLNVVYELHGLQRNEFAVKGTYIDPRIIPGFKYRVRYLGKHTRYVFDEPRRLVGIGQGYGRRLTFESEGGCDHFWSDSSPDGFALIPVAMETGAQFALQTESGHAIGRATVTWVAPEPVECHTWLQGATVCARLGVAFKATVSLETCRCLLGCHDYEDIPLCGVAKLEKNGPRDNARVTSVDQVALPGYPHLQLVPLA